MTNASSHGPPRAQKGVGSEAMSDVFIADPILLVGKPEVHGAELGFKESQVYGAGIDGDTTDVKGGVPQTEGGVLVPLVAVFAGPKQEEIPDNQEIRQSLG
jgi:hypothetical protein